MTGQVSTQRSPGTGCSSSWSREKLEFSSFWWPGCPAVSVLCSSWGEGSAPWEGAPGQAGGGIVGVSAGPGVALMILGGPFQLRRFYGSVEVCVCLG